MTTHGRPPKFAEAARTALADPRSRRDLRLATTTLRRRRDEAAGELPDWERLRLAGEALKDHALLNLDTLLEQFETAVVQAGGKVHWARDATEAGRIVTRLVQATGESEIVRTGSTVLREIGLDGTLAAAGITARGAGLAELIAGLGHDGTAAHRAEIRELFLRELPGVPPDLTDDPATLAEAARHHLRERLLPAKAAVSGADFLVADTGTVVLLESEGDGRMCLTLPETLITVAGIEQVVPRWRDLEVMMQLLPRSSTGARMNPCTTMWTGVAKGDGPREFHLVLLDNGRTRVLKDEVGRAALRCVRCSACQNVCPVYERVGDHAYGAAGSVGSALAGPIVAILVPQARGVGPAYEASLPFASTLCGACADVCPVRIDIPGILVRLRARVVESRRRRPVPTPELAMMRTVAWTMGDQRRYEQALAQAVRWGRLLGRGGRVRRLPGLLGKWTDARDLPVPALPGFREWWRSRR